MTYIEIFFDSWVWSVIDLAVTTYLVYYYISNEFRKDNA